MRDVRITGDRIAMVAVVLLTAVGGVSAQSVRAQRVADAAPGAVRLMTTDAIITSLEAIRRQAEQAMGRPLVIQYGSARGNLRTEILAGQAFDVALLLPDVNEQLLAAGKITSPGVTIARVDIAIGLRGDVRTVDVSTPEALKKAMLGARHLKWAPTGIALFTVNKILDTLDIREAATAKQYVRGSQTLAAGEYELNIYPLSEILETDGLRNLGAVIAPFQTPGVLTAVISTAADKQGADALVRFLLGPAIEPSLKTSGFTR